MAGERFLIDKLEIHHLRTLVIPATDYAQVDWNIDFGVVHESVEELTEAASKNLLTVLE